MRKVILLLSALALLASCSGGGADVNTSPSPSPSPSPSKAARQLTRAEEVAEDELVAQDADDMSTDRAAARQEAIRFVSALPAKWEVVGLHSEHYAANIYLVSVDVRSGAKTGLVEIVVMQFYPEDAEPYWKARPADRGTARLLHALDDIQNLRELNNAKSKIEDLKAERDGDN